MNVPSPRAQSSAFFPGDPFDFTEKWIQDRIPERPLRNPKNSDQRKKEEGLLIRKVKEVNPSRDKMIYAIRVSSMIAQFRESVFRKMESELDLQNLRKMKELFHPPEGFETTYNPDLSQVHYWKIDGQDKKGDDLA